MSKSVSRHANGSQQIVILGASEHNLRHIDITLPRDSLTVFTGVSGSGKSSLAFDTVFKEGQRRFMESLSPYARQFLGQMEKPRVEHVEGLSPTISIDQKTVNRNPRSTLGTVTELYDHFRLLFARLGTPYCPECGILISTLTAEQICDRIFAEQGSSGKSNTAVFIKKSGTEKGGEEGQPCTVFAPMVRERKGEYRKELQQWLEAGYLRARIDGQIRRLDETITLARYEKHTLELVLDRFRLAPRHRSRLVEAVEKALELSGGLVHLEIGDAAQAFSSSMACPRCQLLIPELEPRLFSFNDPQGACPTCKGLGMLHQYSEALLTFPERSLAQGAFTCFTERGNLVFTHMDVPFFVATAEALGIDTARPWGRLPARARRLLLEGNTETKLGTRNVFRHPNLLLEQARTKGRWPGLVRLLEFIGRFVGSALEKYQEVSCCWTCQGKRLNPVALAVRFHGLHIDTLVSMIVADAHRFFATLVLSEQEQIIGRDIFREIQGRLAFLEDVGVGYLSMDRRANTLSGGESQRIRLARQVGSGLQGVLYVLDEPSIGLHQTDNRKLIATLRRLRDAGNTVFVVEHDEETITAADHVVDLGPGAGSAGGCVLAEGRPHQLQENPDSLSGQYLSGKRSIPVPAVRRKPGGRQIVIKKACRHNLNGLDVCIPLGLLVALTGVSGSGKSSLAHDVLCESLTARLAGRPEPKGLYAEMCGLEHLDKVIEIDQSPIGRTPRSNPVTYTKVFDHIRRLFSQVTEARIRGYAPGRFSFNVKGGRCETCQGAGVRTVEMQFLSDVEVECEECGGRRFNEETLQIHYKQRTIYQVLNMTVDEGADFFAQVPAIAHILTTLSEIGLGYIRLGQPSTTISGGEAQRVKLASELRKKATGRTLYLLDEPTTGLHFHDIGNLLQCLNRLVEQGNSVLVIEHNLDVIKVADHVIDLGPGGGQHGGKLVAAGSPEQVAACSESLTGSVLAEVLKPRVSHAIKPDRPFLRRGARDLQVRGAEQHNLKQVDVTIPHNQLTVITGVSGSGKTSLAFHTIFAEGQARYVESLSTYARRFLGRMDKARVGGIEGLAPAIAINQKNSGRSPRSTVATLTEIYDYLRLLYTHVGQAHCPSCDQALTRYTPTALAGRLVRLREGERLYVLAPLYRPGAVRRGVLNQAAQFALLAETLQGEGFTRVCIGTEVVELAGWLALPATKRKLKADVPIALMIDRLRISASERKRLGEACELAFARGQGLAQLVFPDDAGAGTDKGQQDLPWPGAKGLVSEVLSCPECDHVQASPFSPRMFSFNSHVGACEACAGLGQSLQVDPKLLLPFSEYPLLRGALLPGKVGSWLARRKGRAERAIRAFARSEGIDLSRAFKKLSPGAQALLLHGGNKGDKEPLGRRTAFKGLAGIVLDEYRSSSNPAWSTQLEQLLADVDCPHCQGERLKPAYRAVRLAGRNISAFCRLTVKEALGFIAGLKLSKTEQKVAEQPLQEVRTRLGFLKNVGLGYLNLGREAVTLSGGEAQRIRLASQLGSHLVGVLYVLDEPTIGLHPRDTARLLETLKRLREQGNSVLVVEHDLETIMAADHVIDIGPGAGHHGGEVVAAGSPAELMRHPHSLTGAYLSGSRAIPLPATLRSPDPQRQLQIRGARGNNLKGFDVDFPLGAFIAVSGVSGSGKSTLVVEILQKALQRRLGRARVVPAAHDAVEGLEWVDKLVVIDQAPIGKTPKSNPATYTGVLDGLRNLMAQMPEAKTRGYQPGRFSFNVRGGRCEACEGRGFNRIEMHFLADVWVPCEVCEGKRYNQETLRVTFRGKHMADLLDMEIGTALELCAHQPRIRRQLQTLVDVGLGYMKLGQPANTLSGGEAQRVKLATEFGRPRTGRTVYVLDEPTTGLHLDDVARLLDVLHKLADEGNTVIVIEHNLEVIKTADHVIDLGPEGGEGGGEVVAVGTPAQLARQRGSHTGKALRPVLKASPKISSKATATSSTHNAHSAEILRMRGSAP